MNYKIRKTLQHHKLKSYLHSDLKIPNNAIDCSLGINPFGCSPNITKEVFLETYKCIMPYPSYPYPELRKAIADYLSPIADIKTNQLALQTGSIEMIITLNRLFIEEETKILAGAPSFSSALTDMRARGGKIDLIFLNEKEKFKFSVDSYINELKPEHSVVYIDNPNNPTGQLIFVQNLEKLAKLCLKQETILIIDEAYGDFMELENSAVSLVNKYENIIVTKTLSKGFGLAGLRTGYAVVPRDFVKHMQKLPGEMTISEIAVKLIPHALKDTKHLSSSKEKIKINKEKLIASLKVLKSSETHSTVPITLLYTEKDVNLYEIFIKHGIITERGEDFDGLGKRHIRIRVPKKLDKLLPRILNVEKELKNL